MRRFATAALTALAAVGTTLLCSAAVASAQQGGQLFLPLSLLHSGADRDPELAPPPPEVEWSTVIENLPRFPGARLDLYRFEEEGAGVAALYAATSGSVNGAMRWYAEILPGHGWRLIESRPGSSRWFHYDGWLEVGPVQSGREGPWLRLAREARAARGVDGASLHPTIVLPESAVRLGYDRQDLFVEELTLPYGSIEARLALSRTLAADGWLPSPVHWLGEEALMSYRRDRDSILIAVRPSEEEGSLVGIGHRLCLPEPLDSEEYRGSESIYLVRVPAPARARLQAFSQLPETGRAREEWRIQCGDVDRFAADYWRQLVALDWHVPGLRAAGSGASAAAGVRDPGSFSLSVEPSAGGTTLDVSARVAFGGGLSIVLERSDSGRRTSGSSLLFGDLPLPEGSRPLSLSRDTGDGWDFRERYALPEGGPDDYPGWFREAMPAHGWQYERPDPPETAREGAPGGGRRQVYSKDGEEAMVGVVAGKAAISRRRLCPSDEPLDVPTEGPPSRWLLEVPVYPGAEAVGFDGPQDQYRVKCASLSQMAEWYRSAMERGDWRLAATEGPEDPQRRRQLFVRPGELELSPEERTAWAEVVLERRWPYVYLIGLSRDPGGIRRSPAFAGAVDAMVGHQCVTSGR